MEPSVRTGIGSPDERFRASTTRNDSMPLDKLQGEFAELVDYMGVFGWDVIFFDYVDGAIDLKQNADNLARFIEHLDTEAPEGYHLAVMCGSMGGIVARTFTAPLKTVERANTRALKDMGIKVVSRETNEDGERVVSAQANDREIEILLEPLSPKTTRIRARATEGILHDAATATEIILQTERVLARG